MPIQDKTSRDNTSQKIKEITETSSELDLKEKLCETYLSNAPVYRKLQVAIEIIKSFFSPSGMINSKDKKPLNQPDNVDLLQEYLTALVQDFSGLIPIDLLNHEYLKKLSELKEKEEKRFKALSFSEAIAELSGEKYWVLKLETYSNKKGFGGCLKYKQRGVEEPYQRNLGEAQLPLIENILESGEQRSIDGKDCLLINAQDLAKLLNKTKEQVSKSWNNLQNSMKKDEVLNTLFFATGTGSERKYGIFISKNKVKFVKNNSALSMSSS